MDSLRIALPVVEEGQQSSKRVGDGGWAEVVLQNL
jgi:hypothetical protein